MPLAVLVDELTELTSQKSLGHDIFGQDLELLLNMYARNFNVWLTLAHQERAQLSPEINAALDGMGTQVLGVTSDRVAADYLASRYFERDPYREKYREPVYATISDGMGNSFPAQIDWRLHYMPLEEQAELNAQYFMRQRPFHYLIRPCTSQGDVSSRVFEADLSYLDAGQWPDENRALIDEARETLFSLEGLPTEEALAVVEKRHQVLPGYRNHGADAGILGSVTSDDINNDDEQFDQDFWDTREEAGPGVSPSGAGR